MRWIGVVGLIAWTALAVTSSAATPVTVTPPTFCCPTSLATGNMPRDVAIADVNADGKLDLVTANALGKSISVLLNDGRGKFQPRQDYDSPREPHSLAIVDVNGDGRPDVLTAEPRPSGAGRDTSGGTVSEFFNDGHGTFRLERRLNACTGGSQFGTGDLNGDGKVDIVTASPGCYGTYNSLYIFLNEGNGSVKRPIQCGTGPNTPAVSAAIGDLNGDGKQDLVTGSAASISVRLNDGVWEDCSSKGGDYRTGGYTALSLAIADLNGDTKRDVVTANYYGDTVSVLLNNGNGTFGTHVDYATGHRPSSVAVGDLNGDRKPDLAIANSDAKSISLLAGNGDGTFEAKRDFWANSDIPAGVAIGDLNGDRLPDLTVANQEISAVSVFFNTTTVCRVPNVRGKKLADARRALARAHCRTGTIRHARSNAAAKGRVVAERPAPGTILSVGAKVDLAIGRGR